MENLPEEYGKWMIYYETRNNKNFKSRIENFTYYHQDINEFVEEKITPVLSLICDKEMILFKDKINWKLSKGDGFIAHHVQAAWSDFNIERFYSVALFAGPSIKENGCLQFVTDENNIGLLSKDGCLPQEIEKKFNWEYFETYPRDLLIFDSYIPHKSDKNNSGNSRSIFYFTFNSLEEGNFYTEYVKKKRQHFPPPNERGDKSVNIENNKYNLGNPLT